MTSLSLESLKQLEDACIRGRRASESACRSALGWLGVAEAKVPAYLSESDRDLRHGLRAKRRQLGDGEEAMDLLVAECAFEQWHRLLFARFLADNGLLIHPDYGAPVTLAECEELAEDLGEPDGWAVAGRFAAQILPGIFRLDDPCVQLRLAPEGRLELEQIIAGLHAEVFVADDALGWVYQFWQREKKDAVNASERKIGGADLGPVTQLFTEDYMVRFLLENSLGAWWATRHPESRLIADWRFLRFDDAGLPAAGLFDRWPDRVAEITVMDPCCGSGHFLVKAFSVLWPMRVEEEGLSPVAAQDAVLRDNLFGLELDPRCVQIAMCAIALQAWKAGGGWRELPVPHIACSGIPVKAPVDEWTRLAEGDGRLEDALLRLHALFQHADTLGSLIDPKRAAGMTDSAGGESSLEDADWHELLAILNQALSREADDPAMAVLGAHAAATARAANYLSGQYTLVATNVPYLHSQFQDNTLKSYCQREFPLAKAELATVFLERLHQFLEPAGVSASVTPQNWTFLTGYRRFRERLLTSRSLLVLASLGSGAFRSITGEVVQPVLAVIQECAPDDDTSTALLDLRTEPLAGKVTGLESGVISTISQRAQRNNPDMVITFEPEAPGELLSLIAEGLVGIQTGDNQRFVRFHWERSEIGGGWERLQGTPSANRDFDGRAQILLWEQGRGQLLSFVTEQLGEGAESAWIRGRQAWGRAGVVLSRAGDLRSALYSGELFLDSAAVILPSDPSLLPAVFAYCSSPDYVESVRRINKKLVVTNKTLVKVPFDEPRWKQVAEQRFPHGLPEPWSNDPTQWIFEGRPEVATEPLQVAVARLVGYRWPEQSKTDDLDPLVDDDGIVCLPSVLGERAAADRLLEILSRAFGQTWSPTRTADLLAGSGSAKKDLESWLRDDFFKAHCKVFKNRPFIWHVWDGRKDGFAALVNYHRLDRSALERLAYTYLGDWIERQAVGVRDDVAGAEERLAASRELQRRLELILNGEAPYDIFVRWKSLAAQPTGWNPDLDDGVRLNSRPFVEAGVLRSKFNVKWGKDRGKNPDGSERLNDLHFSLADKQAARQRAGL